MQEDRRLRRVRLYTAFGEASRRPRRCSRALPAAIVALGCLALAVVAWIVVVAAHGGCTPVVVELDWSYSTQFAGILQAVHQGHYRDNGLCVTLKPNPATERDVIAAVVAHPGVSIGLSEGAPLLKAASEGVELVAVASMLQSTPLGWMALGRHRDCAAVRCMNRSTVAIHPDGSLALDVALGRSGLTRADVEVVSAPASLTPLLNGTVDWMQGYVFDEYVSLRAADANATITLAADHGDGSYAEVLFTTADVLRNSPDAIGAFVDATRLGWFRAASHEDETVELLWRRYDATHATARDVLAAQLRAVLRLVMPPGAGSGAGVSGRPLARMRLARWEDEQRQLLRHGLIARAVDLSKVVVSL